MSKLEKELFQEDFKKEDVRINREALALLRHLKMALKIAKIYDFSNQLVQEQIRLLFSLIQAILQQERDAILLMRQSSLFFNGSKIRFSFNNYDIVKFMYGEMSKRRIGQMRFMPEITEEEIRNFLILLSTKVRGEGPSFEALAKSMEEKGIKNIKMEQASPFDSYTGNEEEAVKIFFLGVAHLKELFGKFKRGENLPMNTTRRLMHSLFNHISNNEAFALGLTSIKNFDDYTLNHSVNVCILSISLGRRLGLDKNELTDLGIAAFFHDYGKMEIPREILEKPGKLEEDEWKLMESHSQIGAEKLLTLKEVSPVPVGAINVAIEHHVREDLTGYPQYQKKKYISLYSKIVRVADVFDALTTQRPYRDNVFTRDEGLRIMLADAGVGFDPILLKVFVQMMGVFPVGTFVQLNTGELGIVFEPNPEPTLSNRPKVKIIADKEGRKVDGDIIDTAEMAPDSDRYPRTIAKSLDPAKYGVRVADYFLARGQMEELEPPEQGF